jgi:hypothetical protein
VELKERTTKAFVSAAPVPSCMLLLFGLLTAGAPTKRDPSDSAKAEPKPTLFTARAMAAVAQVVGAESACALLYTAQGPFD